MNGTPSVSRPDHHKTTSSGRLQKVLEETCESTFMLEWIDKTEDCGRLFIEEKEFKDPTWSARILETPSTSRWPLYAGLS
jgi:hypothetical protein